MFDSYGATRWVCEQSRRFKTGCLNHLKVPDDLGVTSVPPKVPYQISPLRNSSSLSTFHLMELTKLDEVSKLFVASGNNCLSA